MKKNLFYYLFAVICSVTLFTSCSDDDDEKMVNPVPQTTFTGENGLQLTYNGAPIAKAIFNEYFGLNEETETQQQNTDGQLIP